MISYSGIGSQGLRFRRLIGEEIDFVAVGNQLMQPLLQDDTITAIAVAYEAGTEDLRKLWLQYQSSQAQGEFVKLDEKSRSNTLPNLQQLNTADSGEIMINRSHCDLKPAYSADLNTQQHTSPGQILLQIHAARGRLHHTNAFVKMLATTLVPIGEDDEVQLKEENRHRPSKFSNLLNFLSTFLYMSKSSMAVGGRLFLLLCD